MRSTRVKLRNNLLCHWLCSVQFPGMKISGSSMVVILEYPCRTAPEVSRTKVDHALRNLVDCLAACRASRCALLNALKRRTQFYYLHARGAIKKRYPNLDDDLRAAVSEACATYLSAPDERAVTQVCSTPGIPLNLYVTDRWLVGPLSNGSTEIAVKVRAFDDVDSDYEFKVRLSSLLDLLSVLTNCYFQQGNLDHEAYTFDLPANPYPEDTEWLDGFPIVDGRLRLEKVHIEFGNKIAIGAIDNDHRLLRAARLFNEGLSLHRVTLSKGDLSTVLFISALEAISSVVDGNFNAIWRNITECSPSKPD